MRINEPVTGNRFTFPADQTLISVTDLKGRITYCNNNFVVVSGYTRDELMGQPHNIIRHPDMPEEAFRDLWATIEKGRPWTGLVKNRRKTGDHYWVRANATPVLSDGRIVGYLSVRTAPKEEEVAAAEGLYAVMRKEAAAGRLIHCLDSGALIRNTLFGRATRALRLEARGQLNLLVLLTAVLPLTAVHLGAPLAAGYAAALVTAILAMTLVWRTFIRPLHGVLDEANRIAAGDLAHWVAITEKGLIGRLQLALAQMAVSVRTVIRDVRHEVANLRGGSQEIAAGNSDLSARTESQASSLEQTTASVEQINDTLKETSQLVSQGAALAGDAASASRRSHEAVQTVASTMKDIAQSSSRIGNIIQVIEGVAFQTNLLALNAAVEAARAGEQGRGFAVVASEVRALAGRTSSAAREIRGLIEESLRHVESGSTQTAQAQARMDEAMDTVERTTALLRKIHHATVEQETGMAQIRDAISDLDGITQQNAAMVEELAAAAKSMDDQVVSVHSSIRVFRLTDKDVTLAEEDAVALRRQFQKHEPDNLPHFDEAIATHQQWRVALRNAVLKGTGINADELRRDDCCDLGLWLGGAGARRWNATPGFNQLVQEHTRFHAEAGKVADAINQKQPERATKMLEPGSTFVEAGKHLTQAIRELRGRINGGGGDVAALPAAKKTSSHSDAHQWETF